MWSHSCLRDGRGRAQALGSCWPWGTGSLGWRWHGLRVGGIVLSSMRSPLAAPSRCSKKTSEISACVSLLRLSWIPEEGWAPIGKGRRK